jgi:hypothetical protein
MAGYTRVDFSSAHGAASATESAAIDVADARGASLANRNNVVGDLTDVEGSRQVVVDFMDDLEADLNARVSEVEGSDWESGSKDTFVAHVNELKSDMARLEANYLAEYDAAMTALARLRDAVEVLDSDFGAACARFEGEYSDSGRRAHSHIDQVETLSNQSLG